MEYMQLVSSIVAAEVRRRPLPTRQRSRKRPGRRSGLRPRRCALPIRRGRGPGRKVAAQEAQFAQESIDQLNSDLERDMARMEEHYRSNQSQWAEELFRPDRG